MTEEPTPKSEADPAPEGVFGNLPGSRPGTRSPRRDRAGAAKPPGASAAKPKPAKAKAKQQKAAAKAEAASSKVAAPAAAPRPRPGPTAGPRSAPVSGGRPGESPPRNERTPVEDERHGGLEDIAWAGVAAAAEAATLGVRLASRAIEALRGSSERT